MNRKPTEARGTSIRPNASVGQPPETEGFQGAVFSGERHGSIGGFSLLELLIVVSVLGILAAVVVPVAADASRRARETSLAENLREMRTAIERYQAEHRGVAPGYPSGDITSAASEKTFIAQLTNRTTGEGVVIASVADGGPATAEELKAVVNGGVERAAIAAGDGARGPYVLEIPENPVNGSNRIRVVGDATDDTALKPDENRGWVYRARDGRFQSNVSGKALDGKAYEEM